MTTTHDFIWSLVGIVLSLPIWPGEPSKFLDFYTEKAGWTDTFAPDCILYIFDLKDFTKSAIQKKLHEKFKNATAVSAVIDFY